MVDVKNIGIIGSDGVAQQLALNFSRSGFRVSLLTRDEPGIETKEQTKELQDRINNGDIQFASSFQEVATNVRVTTMGRRVFLLTFNSKDMIKETLDQMSEYLVHGDIILDGDLDEIAGLRYRQTKLGERGITFVDMNVPKDKVKSKEQQENESPSYNEAEHEAVRYVLDITSTCLQSTT